VTTEDEKKKQEKREHASTFGRKSTVPYALYRMHGFISAVDAQKTGFNETDLELLWESLLNAFEHDRAAARGEMNPRALIVFKHESHLGNARSGELLEKIIIEKNVELPRSWNDYKVIVPKQKDLPNGVSIDAKLNQWK
jgi:CRISPR-associated protein Csd2